MENEPVDIVYLNLKEQSLEAREAMPLQCWLVVRDGNQFKACRALAMVATLDGEIYYLCQDTHPNWITDEVVVLTTSAQLTDEMYEDLQARGIEPTFPPRRSMWG